PAEGGPRTRWRDSPPQERAVGRYRITDDLLFELSWQVEFDPARHVIVVRQSEMEAVCRKGDGPALDQERSQHDHEGDIEIDERRRQAHEQWNRSQEYADGPAQPDPGDERLLAP